MNWKKQLKYDPIPPLLSCGHEAIIYFTQRDLLNRKVADITRLWDLKSTKQILNKQQKDGRWKYPNPRKDLREEENYDQVETYRQLGFLIEKFGLNKDHKSIQKAKDFILKHQTREGDIRGIYWNQYSPNYTAGFLELLIKAGYGNNPKIRKGLHWLLSVRQNDGGWVIPIRTAGVKLKNWFERKDTVQPDRSKPFSYMVTGVVLRAFAYHKDYKKNPDILKAAELVLSRMFQKDVYPDRNKQEHWTSFSFPFWFTDLIAVLDPIAHLGFKPTQKKVKEGLAWLRKEQNKDGTWRLKLLKGDKIEQPFWMNLNICRLFKKFHK